jgi:ketosteroid isomerase-like protein
VSLLTDIHVTTLSNDVAIIAALNKITITENNHTDDLMGRLSIAARKRAGLWKIEHFHRSALPN